MVLMAVQTKGGEGVHTSAKTSGLSAHLDLLMPLAVTLKATLKISLTCVKPSIQERDL